MQFSEQYGYKKVREALQVDSMDEELRNSLWNVLKLSVFDKFTTHIFTESRTNSLYDPQNEKIKSFCIWIWFNYFKKPLDEINDWINAYSILHDYFFKSEWYDVYDFIESIAEYLKKQDQFIDDFIQDCNSVLEREKSAYRFVNGRITRMIDEHEIESVQTAIDQGSDPVKTHLLSALELLSDRQLPDYRNSIKESICAIESLAREITGSEKAKFGELINKLSEKTKIHPALKKAFNNLYGYSSDAPGIRHGHGPDTIYETPNFEDAKFFLVACSAFVNYVKEKVERSR